MDTELRQVFVIVGVLAGLLVLGLLLRRVQKRWGRGRDGTTGPLAPPLGTWRDALRSFSTFIPVLVAAGMSLYALHEMDKGIKKWGKEGEQVSELVSRTTDIDVLCKALLSPSENLRAGAVCGAQRLLGLVSRGEYTSFSPAWCRSLAERLKAWFAANRERLQLVTESGTGGYLWKMSVPEDVRSANSFEFKRRWDTAAEAEPDRPRGAEP